jgi:hypothetical protein
MDIVAAIFFEQDFAIAGHQDGDRIGQQEHPRRNGTRPAVGSLVPHSSVFKVHRIHQMVQSHVSVVSAHASEHGG